MAGSTFKFLSYDQTFSSVAAPFQGSTRNTPVSRHPHANTIVFFFGPSQACQFEQLLGVDGREHSTAPRLLLSGRGHLGENVCWGLGLAAVARLNPALWGNWAFVHVLSVLLGGVFGLSGWGFPQEVLLGRGSAP